MSCITGIEGVPTLEWVETAIGMLAVIKDIMDILS